MAQSPSKPRRGLRIVLYGAPGTGKTTLACHAPGAVVVDTEGGLDYLSTKPEGLPVRSVESYEQWRTALVGLHQYRTVVVDTIASLDEMLCVHLTRQYRAASVADIGGWGIGYSRLETQFDYIMADLKQLSAHSHVIVVSHAERCSVNTPEGASYMVAMPRTKRDKHSVALVAWADIVIYASMSRDKNPVRTYRCDPNEGLATKCRVDAPQLVWTHRPGESWSPRQFWESFGLTYGEDAR